MAKTIKIKRSGDVFQSEREAIAFLSRTPHQPGQPILVRYWASDTETDAILAIGTQTGVGPGTYTIASVSGVKVVTGIIKSESELPDSSQMINGETWLYQEPVTYDLYWIYLYEDTRKVTPVDPDINYHIFSLSDDSEYRLYGGSLERSNDYYSQETVDRKVSELSEEITSTANGLSDRITSGFQSVFDALGVPSSEYPGTIAGAGNFNEADSLLQSQISQISQNIQRISNRVSDLEKELTSDSEGLTTSTRLDTLYSWYNDVIHTPKYSIEFVVDPEVSLIQGSIVQVKVIYRWSWVDRCSYVGLKLNNEFKPFGLNGVANPDVADGYYEWTVDVPLTETVTLEASFDGSTDNPVTYVLEPTPVQRSIEISWPTQSWNSQEFTYTVSFTGTGLQPGWADDELFVIQDGVRVFQDFEGQGSTQNSVYTGTLDPQNQETRLEANWDTTRAEEIFCPTWLIILPKNTEVATETLEEAEQVYVSYQEFSLFETPEITYEPDQTLVILSPHSLDDSNVKYTSNHSEPVTITSDFTEPSTIGYHGTTYNYISFPKIGAGSFKFILA